ncbi:hypothetical protein AURANDRAFT_55044 [Aureococcus anophagefferens]|uniref:protein-serine/threonine phosphatase n=1 Tax=Aureococcus anophagefferens TaxID=44056 RepID=F0YJG9_AURAN|nr:hypothetical protein AURANDRAFT_55044 [Aureococcus anophagefferens]EGB04648.1 hypothetical protein AURANDRAFT_55044 [Aureococcus anophagefferens]|eukprot:XP_009040563.1 hypothetical protein AURANDRAFT_55044 [Aureococcus anophagefferens]
MPVAAPGGRRATAARRGAARPRDDAGPRRRHARGWAESERGVSYTFGEDVVAKFLEAHDLDLLVRAHQVVEDGYEFFANRMLVTLFSAPNYCGEFDNAGAVMAVDDTLMCSFHILQPAAKPQPPRPLASRAPTPR